MQNTSKKIFAVQDDEETLKYALNKVKNTDNNLLVTNCISRLKLGDKKLHIIFDTLLYNDEKNILIMVKDSSMITPEMFKELLDNNGVNYNELNFREYLHFDKPELAKELFFATDLGNFKYAIENSQSKGIENCTYYPAITGHFTLKYFFNKEKQEELDDFYVKGIIELEDKIILVISGRDESNLYHKRIIYELDKMKMDTKIDYSKEIEEPLREKVMLKRNNDEYL